MRRGKAAALNPTIIRHSLARAHHWTFQEIDEMSMRDVLIEMALIAEDRIKRS